MKEVRELEIIKAALEHDMIQQEDHMNELAIKRMNYPLEVSAEKFNEFYNWLSDTRRLHKRVTITLSNKISEESRIITLERKIEMLEGQLSNNANGKYKVNDWIQWTEDGLKYKIIDIKGNEYDFVREDGILITHQYYKNLEQITIKADNPTL